MADTDYTLDQTALFTEVLELLGALGEGESPSADQTTSLQRTLNMLLKHWQGPNGPNLYSVRETFLFLRDGVNKYDQLDFNGTTGLDVDRNHIYVSNYEKVDFTDIASGATTVEVAESFISGDPVDSATTGDVVGIPLEDGTVHWAEITSVGTSGSFSKSFTFSGHSLPSDADADKKMIVGTSYPGRPLKLLAVTLRQIFDEDERELQRPMAIADYARIANKASSTSVNQVFYNRETTTGDLRTWGTVGSDNYVLVLWAHLPLRDIDTDINLNHNNGLPQEFYMAFAYSLAEALLPKYAPPPSVERRIVSNAQMFRDEAFDYDTEEYLKIEPDMEGRRFD